MAKTILLVDDSATIVMSVKLTLEMSGFVVKTANDGLQGLAVLKDGPKPDIIITDVNMPNMNGMEFIKAVRALPGFSFVPILTLTTESEASKRDEAKKLGASGWLVKPVSGPDLVKVVKQLVPGA
jgi:two-component system chemotaxis response regulator CheY